MGLRSDSEFNVWKCLAVCSGDSCPNDFSLQPLPEIPKLTEHVEGALVFNELGVLRTKGKEELTQGLTLQSG